ncbi:hypothetical protein BDZ85DRAFT_259372 [Elsinoe ampelina]|uniref:DUF3752 domain-containing protein n=1 Tax=Elsinoe ampelina TaxID=302913 RepID=A0A6A6GH59_9PEZI|nr:hypothetical protein BDZ85DRAFT_259372 [Elsinoe ampelina]
MSAIGPALPPHLLAKRKRQQEEDDTDAGTGGPGAKRPKSPEQKSSRQIGPAAPPAPLDQRPAEPANADSGDDSSDDDDDFGPSLPTGDGANSTVSARPAEAQAPLRSEGSREQASATSRRDEWMMVPPKQDDLSARMDPTKLRARGFNTGKGAKGSTGPGGDNDTWTETPEQKRQRLENQVMGVKKSTDPIRSDKREEARRREEKEKAAKIKEARGGSLYDQHQKRADVEQDDDPSQRAFDREKDMSTGMKIGGKQKKELLSKASNFGSKFASGSFL